MIKHHRSRNLFAINAIRDTKTNSFRNGGMTCQYLINLYWGNLLPTANNHLLDSTHQCEIAIRIQVTLVAGPKPTVSKSSSICFGVVFVTAKDTRAFDCYLALNSSRQPLTV